MFTRILAIVSMLLCGSAAITTAASHHSRDANAVKVDKDTEKDKDNDQKHNVSVVSVPDGGSTAVLLVLGVLGVSVWAFRGGLLRQRRGSRVDMP